MRRASKRPWAIRRIDSESPKSLFGFYFTRFTKVLYLLRTIDTGMFVKEKLSTVSIYKLQTVRIPIWIMSPDIQHLGLFLCANRAEEKLDYPAL